MASPVTINIEIGGTGGTDKCILQRSFYFTNNGKSGANFSSDNMTLGIPRGREVRWGPTSIILSCEGVCMELMSSWPHPARKEESELQFMTPGRLARFAKAGIKRMLSSDLPRHIKLYCTSAPRTGLRLMLTDPWKSS